MQTLSANPILDTCPVTETSLLQLRQMPDEQAAPILDARMGVLEDIWKTGFIERGLILLEFEERLLWKHLTDPETGKPYPSKEAWIIRRCPQSRSDCFAALRAVKELRDVPKEQLREIPRCNISVLQLLSSKVRQQPEVIEAAKTMTERQFVETIERDHPTQHIESKRFIRLAPSSSAYAIIEQGFRDAMEHDGYTTKEEVLEAWAMNQLNGHVELLKGNE